ncbi:uncharacterized protein LOC62_07G009075 [Vanrija pseudolonga]|nr:hypothetical protein LOC62_07G009075 [Vanrija pseudolonga]
MAAELNGSRLPVVPPRSHLRPSAPPSSTASSSSSPCSSTPSSSTASPLPSRSSSLARSTTKSASSVEVHTPSPPSTPLTPRHFNVSSPMGGGNTDFGPKLGPHEHEVIQFSKPVRKRNMHGSVSSIDRDPFKVRDGIQSRKSSSGVYTPHTFPGPSVRPNQAFPATSPTTSTFSHDSSHHHQHPHHSHHKQAHRVRSLGSFQRFSMHLNKESEPPVPPLPISNPRSSYHHPHTQYVAPKPSSYSPTSARSGGSISPPDTPTTPTSVNIAGHRVPASSVARPVVIMSNDFGPGVDFSRSPVESAGLGLGLEDAKLPPTPLTPSYILRSSMQAPQLPPIDASPSALPSPPAAIKTSPAPKRTRRKPVPRLDEDVIEHLEALETGSDARPHAL